MYCQITGVRGSKTYFFCRESCIDLYFQILLIFRCFLGLVCIPPVAVSADEIDKMIDFMCVIRFAEVPDGIISAVIAGGRVFNAD